jgi:dTDP-glucose 4,6-dehydratase
MGLRQHPVRSLSGLADRDLDDIVAQSRRWTGALREARILVTGATGWFGTWLLDALVAIDRSHGLGLRIVAVSRDPQRFAARHPELANAPSIEWIAADVRDAPFDVAGPVSHVIHAATDASAALNAAAPALMFDTIVEGTRNVLRVASDANAKRFLLLSSGAVYGPQPAQLTRLDESYPGAPDPLSVASAYAEGKRAAEQLAAIARAAEGLEPVIARCFAFVGPHMPFDTHFAIGNFMRDALERDAIVIRGDGLPTRSYLYMSDLVAWLLTLLVEAAPMRAYNVGSPEPIPISGLAQRRAALARQFHGRFVDVRVEGVAAGGASYVPCTRRADEELDLRARVGLDEAITRTMAWRLGRVAGSSNHAQGASHHHA